MAEKKHRSGKIVTFVGLDCVYNSLDKRLKIEIPILMDTERTRAFVDLCKSCDLRDIQIRELLEQFDSYQTMNYIDNQRVRFEGLVEGSS